MYHEEEELHRELESMELNERQNSEEKRSIGRKSSDMFAGLKNPRLVKLKEQIANIRRKKIAQVSRSQTFHLHREKHFSISISLPLGT